MTTIVLDTHVWAWMLLRSGKLSPSARATNDLSTRRLVSAASIYEISQKCRIGRWPEMAPSVDRLIPSAAEQGLEIVDLKALVCLRAGTSDWSHRDPFDRLIAATAFVTASI